MIPLSPTGLLVAVLAWVGSLGGCFWFAHGVGKNSEIANRVENEELVRVTREAAQEGAAHAIAANKPKHITIRQALEREVRTNVVYRDCRHTADGLRILNEALTGKPGPDAAGGVRPDGGSAGRRLRDHIRDAGGGRDAVP